MKAGLHVCCAWLFLRSVITLAGGRYNVDTDRVVWTLLGYLVSFWTLAAIGFAQRKLELPEAQLTLGTAALAFLLMILHLPLLAQA